jgi:hypothetical protein
MILNDNFLTFFNMREINFYPINKGLLFTAVLFLFLIPSSVFSQDVTLELVQKSRLPLSSVEHFHLFEVTNNSKKEVSINIEAIQVNCESVTFSQLNLDFILLDENRNKINKINLSSNQKLQFYLKTNNPNKKANSFYNCIEIYVNDVASNSKVSSLILKSLVPNPNSFN